MSLQPLVLDFRKGCELIVMCLYRTQERAASSASPNSGVRRREVEALAASGLEDALQALKGGAGCVGTSGFTQREDVLLVRISPDANMLAKGA